jgi:hypothetical protein
VKLPNGGWNLHQRSASGCTARVPLREMTIKGYCHVGQETPGRLLAIANPKQRVIDSLSIRDIAGLISIHQKFGRLTTFGRLCQGKLPPVAANC